jgi:hypothetical protein
MLIITLGVRAADGYSGSDFDRPFWLSSPEMDWVCLLYDDGPTPRRIEPLLIFTDVEIPVGIEIAAQV